MRVTFKNAGIYTAMFIFAGATFTAFAQSNTAQQQAGSGQTGGQAGGQGNGRGMRGMAGGRGVFGTVTEATGDHYTIKTDAGEVYIVHFSVNTRIMKQPAGRPGGRRGQNGGQTGGQGGDAEGGDGGERQQPQALKPTDIKVGDMITAGGEMDAASKSVGAVFILQLDPERAKQARAMQANFGKTWLAGRITAIDGTKITIEGIADHAPHSLVVDENTSFRSRRDSITLADIKVGEQLRAEGAVKDGVFVATTVNAAEFESRGEGRGPNGLAPPGAQVPVGPQ